MSYEYFYRIPPTHPFTIALRKYRSDNLLLREEYAALADQHELEARDIEFGPPPERKLLIRPTEKDQELHLGVMKNVRWTPEGYMGFRTSSKIADDWRQRLEEKGLVPGDEPSIITHYPHLNKYDKMVDPHIKSFTYLAGEEALLHLQVDHATEMLVQSIGEVKFYEQKLRQHLTIEKGMNLPRIPGSQFFQILHAEHVPKEEFGFHPYTYEMPRDHPGVVQMADHRASCERLRKEFEELANKYGMETRELIVGEGNVSINPTNNDLRRFRGILHNLGPGVLEYGYMILNHNSDIMKEWFQRVKEKELTVEPSPDMYYDYKLYNLTRGDGWSSTWHSDDRGRGLIRVLADTAPRHEACGVNPIPESEYFAGMAEYWQVAEQAGLVQSGSDYYRKLRETTQSRMDEGVHIRNDLSTMTPWK